MRVKRKDFQKAAAFIHEFLLKLSEDLECAELRDTLNLALLHMQKYYRILRQRTQERGNGQSLQTSLRGMSPMTPFKDAPDKFQWRWIDLDTSKLSSSLPASGHQELDSLPLIIQAAKEGDCNLILELFEKDPGCINEIDAVGRTALMHAVHFGHKDAVQILLENGADPNITSNDSSSAVHHACLVGNMDTLQILIDSDSDLSGQDTQGRAPIHWACTTQSRACLRLLVNQGVNVNIRDIEGMSPSMWACRLDHIEHFQLLTAVDDQQIEESDGFERDSNGKTWMHWSVRRTEPLECLRTLLTEETGKMKDNEGKTVMHTAAEIGSLDSCKIIVEIVGVKTVHDRDDQNRTPLHLATMRGHGEVVNYLLENGADYEAEDDNGATAWDYARGRQLHYCMLIIASYIRQKTSSSQNGDYLNGFLSGGPSSEDELQMLRRPSHLYGGNKPITPPHPPTTPKDTPNTPRGVTPRGVNMNSRPPRTPHAPKTPRTTSSTPRAGLRRSFSFDREEDELRQGVNGGTQEWHRSHSLDDRLQASRSNVVPNGNVMEMESMEDGHMIHNDEVGGHGQDVESMSIGQVSDLEGEGDEPMEQTHQLQPQVYSQGVVQRTRPLPLPRRQPVGYQPHPPPHPPPQSPKHPMYAPMDAMYHANPEEYIDHPEEGTDMTPPATARGPQPPPQHMPRPPPTARSPPPTARHPSPPYEQTNQISSQRGVDNYSGYADYPPVTARGPGPRPQPQGQGDDEMFAHPPQTARGPPSQKRFVEEQDPEYRDNFEYVPHQQDRSADYKTQHRGRELNQKEMNTSFRSSPSNAPDGRYEEGSAQGQDYNTENPMLVRGSSAGPQRPQSGHGKLSPLSPTAPPQPLKPPSPGPLSLTVDGRRVPPPFLAPLPQTSVSKPHKKKKRKKKEMSSSTELSNDGSPNKGYAAPMQPPSTFQPQIQGQSYPLSAYSRHNVPPAKLSRQNSNPDSPGRRQQSLPQHQMSNKLQRMESEDNLNMETASIDSTGPMNMDDEDNERGQDHGLVNGNFSRTAPNPQRQGSHQTQGVLPRQNRVWQDNTQKGQLANGHATGMQRGTSNKNLSLRTVSGRPLQRQPPVQGRGSGQSQGQTPTFPNPHNKKHRSY